MSQVVVYAAYGQAMLSAHALERKLCTLLMTRCVEPKSDENHFDKQMAEIKRLPLGRLIERFIEGFSVEGELQEELDNMLYFRNELAHRIAEMLLRKALDPGWHNRLVTELLEIESCFRETNARLECYLDEWLNANGYKKELLVSMGKAIYKGLVSG